MKKSSRTSRSCHLYSRLLPYALLAIAGFASTFAELHAQQPPALPSATTPAKPLQDTDTLNNPDSNSPDASEESVRKVSGLAVIDKVFARSPELLLRADGYRLRISSTADLTFRDDLNTLSDIHTNIWMHYSGEFDPAGTVIVSQATFLPARTSRFFAVPMLETTPVTVELPPTHKQKRRYSQSDNRFVAIDNDALQQRVQHIGMNVVPEYQKALADDDPSRIRFRFYAVDNPRLRAEVCSSEGLILLPKTVIERLQSDDQLAAVLADGVAANLQLQAARLTSAGRIALGAEIAGDIAGAFIPGVGLGTYVGSAVVGGVYMNSLQRQRSRVALALLQDAGYDLHQAPEAWRLLAPDKLPSNLTTLKPPSQSRYLERIIDRQYRQPAVPAPANSVSESHLPSHL
jgi:hypothetical protein